MSGFTIPFIAFDWSTSEQIYPFETIGGQTVYAKYYSVANFPNSTTANIAHGITDLDRVIELSIEAKSGTTYIRGDANVSSTLLSYVLGSNLVVISTVNYSAYSGKIFIKYTKS